IGKLQAARMPAAEAERFGPGGVGGNGSGVTNAIRLVQTEIRREIAGADCRVCVGPGTPTIQERNVLSDHEGVAGAVGDVLQRLLEDNIGAEEHPVSLACAVLVKAIAAAVRPDIGIGAPAEV